MAYAHGTIDRLKEAGRLACRDFARAAVCLGGFALLLFGTSPEPQMELIGRTLTGFDVEADVGRMLFLAIGFLQAAGWSAIIGVVSLVVRASVVGWRVGQQHLRNRPATARSVTQTGTEAANV